MTYEQYLFSNLWKLRDKEFKQLEYDLQWGSIFVEYDRFITSKFAKLNAGTEYPFSFAFLNISLVLTNPKS